MTKKFRVTLMIGLIIIVGGVLLLGFGDKIQAEPQNESEEVIAYVDVMAVFEAHPEKNTAEAELNQEVLKLQEQLEAEVKDMSQEERKAIMEKYQAQLSQREQELIGRVIQSIDDTIKEVADEMGFKVVLEKKNVIYGGQDITEEVQLRIQQKYAEQ